MTRTARRRHWKDGALGDASLLYAAFENQEFPRHTHATFVVGVNVHGAHGSVHRGSHEVVPAGSFAVVNPGEVHTGKRVGDGTWEYRAIYPPSAFMAELASDLTGSDHEVPWFPEFLVRDPGLAAEFVRAHRALESEPDPLDGESRMIAALTELISRHSEVRAEPPPTGGEAERVETIKAYLLADLRRSVSLADVASVVGLSRYHCLRVFKRETGVTPFRYLMQAKIDRARALLAEGHSISSVAYQLGFCDQSHLTNRFREYVGVTPGEFVGS